MTLRRPARSLLHLVLLALPLACAQSGVMPPPGMPIAAPMKRDEPRLHLELIEKMLDGGRPFAAMAHLDALEPEIAERTDARLLRGETLRRLGRPEEAREIYTSLLDTDSEALARRGLGLLAAGAGDLDGAIAELRLARDLQPTSARIRNDLGYALLRQGSYPEARTELLTATQLGGTERSARNLVLLYLVAGDIAGAERLASEHHIPPASVSRLWNRAQSLRPAAPLEEGDGT
jgi:Flp pilus assembly protein TadD